VADREFTATSFYAFLREGRLMAARCGRCGALCVPPKPLCGECGAGEAEWAELEGKGQVAAFTAIAVAPTFMVEAGYGRNNPYIAGVVELKEGPRIGARILGLDAEHPAPTAVGTPVLIEFPAAEEGARPMITFRVME